MNINELMHNLEVMFPTKESSCYVLPDNTTRAIVKSSSLAHIRIILNDIGVACCIVSTDDKPLMDTIFLPSPLTYSLQRTVMVMDQLCQYVYKDEFDDISTVDINGIGEYVVHTDCGYNNTFIAALGLTSELPKTLSHSYESYVKSLVDRLGPVLILHDAAHNKIRIRLQSGKEETISVSIDGSTNAIVLAELLKGMAYWLSAVTAKV